MNCNRFTKNIKYFAFFFFSFNEHFKDVQTQKKNKKKKKQVCMNEFVCNFNFVNDRNFIIKNIGLN